MCTMFLKETVSYYLNNEVQYIVLFLMLAWCLIELVS